MEIRQLITFVRIIQMNSFSKAAMSLGYSQATVTIQIQQLETEMGTRLFDRIGKSISLTPAGRELREYAHRILNEVDKAKTSIQDDGELHSLLHIGTLESLCFSKLPRILQYFREHHPKVSLRITTDSPQNLIDMMEKNRLDIIYILDIPRYNNNWKKTMEYKEDIVFVAPKKMELANKTLSASELLSYPILLTEQHANYRQALDSFLASKNLSLSPFIEISDTEFIIKMIEQNMGISFLPYFAIQDSLSKNYLDTFFVEDFSVSMYRQIFYHKDKWKSKEMNEFIRLTSI